jgi:hypothetical protein
MCSAGNALVQSETLFVSGLTLQELLQKQF